ncbi:MAG: hypothetical protein QOF51_3183 [Chloroflexota bacterium]|nr:hypothetical protein [Chloroflexota bacterium]
MSGYSLAALFIVLLLGGGLLSLVRRAMGMRRWGWLGTAGAGAGFLLAAGVFATIALASPQQAAYGELGAFGTIDVHDGPKSFFTSLPAGTPMDLSEVLALHEGDHVALPCPPDEAPCGGTRSIELEMGGDVYDKLTPGDTVVVAYRTWDRASTRVALLDGERVVWLWDRGRAIEAIAVPVCALLGMVFLVWGPALLRRRGWYAG